MSTVLPSASPVAPQGDVKYIAPFMLCTLDVNSINFCRAAFCSNDVNGQAELLVAVPGLIGSEYIDVYSLPSALRLVTRIVAVAPSKGKLGNVMSLDFSYPFLAVGYENGSAALMTLDISQVDRTQQKQDGTWKCLKQWTAHREAILSIVLSRQREEMYTCGIDSRLVRYKLTTESNDGETHCLVETRHSGQQSMQLRADAKLLATAGWDSYTRIYTTSKLKQVAVLGFHRSAVNVVCFGPEVNHMLGNIIALGGKDSKISLWKVF